MSKIQEEYSLAGNLCPTTQNILCILNEKGVVRLKKNSSRTKYLDRVYEDFKRISNLYKHIKYYESIDCLEVIIVKDINYQISSFIV